MGPNALLFGWDRSLPGREQLSGTHFQDFLAFLEAQKKQNVIESFDVVLLEPHGAELNGFFLLRGDPDKLSALTNSDEWLQHQMRALLHLQGMVTCRASTGALVPERMQLWMKSLPQQ